MFWALICWGQASLAQLSNEEQQVGIRAMQERKKANGLFHSPKDQKTQAHRDDFAKIN